MFRKITSVFTGITVICWLSGLALLVPLPAQAVTVNEGDLIRGPDGIKVYIVNASNYKRHIFNPDVFDMYGHFTWDSIQEVDQAVLDSYTTSDLYRVDVEHQVYSVGEDGIKHWLDMTAEQFVSEEYSWNQVFIVNAVEGAYYTVGSEITPEPVVPEGLTLALADDTPAAASIPTGSSIEFVKFTLTADEDVNINSIKITAGGIGDYTDIDSVAIFNEDGVRLSSIKVISSDGNAIFNFSTPIEVVTGISRTLTVKATVEAGGTGSLFKLGIANAADIISNATAVGGTEVYGNEMSVLTAAAGTATIAATTSGASNHSFGEDDVLAADFSVVAEDEDLLFSGITFKNGGTRDDDLISNLKLTCDGDELATAELVDNYVSFNFSNVEIEEGDTAICEVRGDLGIGSGDDTIELYLDDASDVNLISKTSGFGATITITDMGSDNAIAITLLAGDFTIDFDKSATPNQEVRPDTDNVVLATLKLTSNAEDATVESITGGATHQFEIQGTGLTDTYITNAEMRDVDTGSIYDLSLTYVSVTEWYLELTEEISLLKGVTKTFEIRVDLEDEAWSDGDTLKVVLEDGAMSITGDISGETIGTGEIMPTSITSATATLETSSLVVTTTTLTNTSIVGGAADVIIYQAVFEAGDSSLVTLKTVRITDTAGENLFDDDYITKLDLYLDGALMDSKSGSIDDEDESITYSSLTTNNVIPAGETVNLVLKATFASDLTSGDIKLAITSTTDDVISRDVDNELIVETGIVTSAVSRTVTLASTGTLKVDLLTTDTRANKNMYTVAGSSGPSGRYLGELVFATENEPVRVTELSLVQEGTADVDDIASVSLVKENGDIVVTKAVDVDGNVVLTNASLEFDADKSTSYFIVANTKGINVDGDPTSTATSGGTIQYSITSVAAEGVDSGEDIIVSGTTQLATSVLSTTATAEWSTTQVNDGNYSAKLIAPLSNDRAGARVAYGKPLSTLFAETTTIGGSETLDVIWNVYYPASASGTAPYAVLLLDTTGDNAVDAAVVGGFDYVYETGLPSYSSWNKAMKPLAGNFQLRDVDANNFLISGTYDAGFYTGNAGAVTLALLDADEGWSIEGDDPVVLYIGSSVTSNTGSSYVDDIVIGGVTYSMEASNVATILGGAVTFVENDMADSALTPGTGKIIGKYAVSIDTGSNRNSDNTPMEVILTELFITPTFSTTNPTVTNIKAYIEGDSSNKTDTGVDGTSGDEATMTFSQLDGDAEKVAGDIVLVIVADIGALGTDYDYVQTAIADLVGTNRDLTYTDSSDETTSNSGGCFLTIDEVIGATLSL